MFPILRPLPPPSPYHPSGLSQCASPKHPVSCIAPGLAIHFTYDILHVSMPFSQIIPPSPSPTITCILMERRSVQFSVSVMSDSLSPHGLQPTRLLHPWDFPGKSTGVGCYCLLRDFDSLAIKMEK